MNCKTSREATDPVSGVVANVAVRVLRGHGCEPMFILVGDKPALPGMPPGAYQADADKLYHAFYSTLPGQTLERLVINYLKGMGTDQFGKRRLDIGQQSAIDDTIALIERSL